MAGPNWLTFVKKTLAKKSIFFEDSNFFIPRQNHALQNTIFFIPRATLGTSGIWRLCSVIFLKQLSSI